MNATAKQEEKLSALLKEAEDFPLLKTLRAEKAAALLVTRTEAAGKIEHPSPSPVHHQPDQDQPDQADQQQQEYGESVDCRDRGGESCLSQ